MTFYTSITPPVLIEELLASKQGLGAEYSFESNTLEIKPNANGVNGVFTRRRLSAGSEVLSVQQKNGCLTPLRAYDEAQELLRMLGSDRYDLDSKFVIASAMYLRCLNIETVHADLLLIDPNIKANYMGSILSCYGSKDLAMLAFPNNKSVLDKATKQNEMIIKMGVDPVLFRAILGYTTSRAWDRYGLIPLLDLFNSSYKAGINCRFLVDRDRLYYQLTRDIDAGEELRWSYNNSNAVATWLNYGYRCYERPTEALLELKLTEEQMMAHDNFTTNKLTWMHKDDWFSCNLIDKSQVRFKLLNPGKMPTLGLVRKSIADCLASFITARTYFRALVMSSEKPFNDTITLAKMQSDEPIFGLNVEQKVMSQLLTALHVGITNTYQRVEQFKASEVGRSVDITPYIQMVQEASLAWAGTLIIIEAICSNDSIEGCIDVINSALELNVKTRSELEPALEQLDKKRPSLTATLILRYMKARSASD